MSEFKETFSPEINREIYRPAVRETEVPCLSPSMDMKDNPFSYSSDIFKAAFEKFGLTADTSDKKASDVKDSLEGKEYSDYLEKGDDGKYYDKETGKGYDSVEEWKKEQENWAKRYEKAAKYYKEKADQEWARFKATEENRGSYAEQWKHYQHSQEYYAKAKEYREKAEKTWAKLGKTSDASNETNQSDTSKAQKDVSEGKGLSGQELLDQARYSADELAQRTDNPKDAEHVKELCDKILKNSECEDEIEPKGGLLPEYQRKMEEMGYTDEEEMCNAEGLNLNDIYDDEPSTYGEEYCQGFIDCIDEDKSPDTTSEDECSEAYYQGLHDAQELKDIINA